MVVWDQRLPHGSAGNRSEKIRCSHFIRAFPSSILSSKSKKKYGTAMRRQLQDMKINDPHGLLGLQWA